jgi:hypothetical protein
MYSAYLHNDIRILDPLLLCDYGWNDFCQTFPKYKLPQVSGMVHAIGLSWGVFVCAHMMLFTMKHQFPHPITTTTAPYFRDFLSYFCIDKCGFKQMGNCPICSNWYTGISDGKYVICEKCNRWCHSNCVANEHLEKGTPYICIFCTNKEFEKEGN